MAVSTIKLPYAFSSHMDTATGIKFEKCDRIGSVFISLNSATYSAEEKICDVPTAFLPLHTVSFRDSLNNVRLFLSNSSTQNGLYAAEAVSSNNLRATITYMTEI